MGSQSGEGGRLLFIIASPKGFVISIETGFLHEDVL